MAIAIPKFTDHYDNIRLATITQEMVGSLDKAEEYANTYGEPIEFVLNEESSGNVCGFQIGKNLNLNGDATLATIFEESQFPRNWIVSSNLNIRKIISKPHAALQLLKGDGTMVTPDNCVIGIKNSHGNTSTVNVNTLTGETSINGET